MHLYLCVRVLRIISRTWKKTKQISIRINRNRIRVRSSSVFTLWVECGLHWTLFDWIGLDWIELLLLWWLQQLLLWLLQFRFHCAWQWKWFDFAIAAVVVVVVAADLICLALLLYIYAPRSQSPYFSPSVYIVLWPVNQNTTKRNAQPSQTNSNWNTKQKTKQKRNETKRNLSISVFHTYLNRVFPLCFDFHSINSSNSNNNYSNLKWSCAFIEFGLILQTKRWVSRTHTHAYIYTI